MILIAFVSITAYVIANSFSNKTYMPIKIEQIGNSTSVQQKKDSITSVKAYMKVHAVLQHPRCMNCHPSGDIPLQGEDSHLHAMLPKRGVDGKGLYAMKCNSCHQPTNTPGLHTPPGNPNWHLPPADMKMVFQGKSPSELAKQLLNPATNNHKNHEQLIEHVSHDKLVIGGWNPGEGRELPPGTHKEFVENFKTWLATGAYIPSEKIKADKK
ncbi:hypothetical protein [Sphingobacterium endophyticum]|uniref:hypothetical protein n=1 Tax=Sphingobacterium endophyticum TaxID=2546448 RepID=UPI0018CD563B|nr:hypothetical protein [Sphingobacterium endophyticum]